MSERETLQRIVDATNDLARLFYSAHGNHVLHGYRFDQATHPQERGMWNLACIAQDYLCGEDPAYALHQLEDL